jgi:hypothetical protein
MQPTRGVKRGMRERKLRSDVNSQGTLKQKDVKPAGVKQGLHLLVHENIVSRLGLFMNCSEYYEE